VTGVVIDTVERVAGEADAAVAVMSSVAAAVAVMIL
jgi:hypothetical protein